MNEKKDTLILILTLIVTGSILGGGYWFLTHNLNFNLSKNNQTLPSDNQNNVNQTPINNSPKTNFSYPQNVPQGMNINIDGSTSMAQINEALKKGFEKEFSGTIVNINAKGSENGIKQLLAGNIDIAAVSRPLTTDELQKGLVAIPITTDAIAIVVGIDNSFRRGLNGNQVVSIFNGQINNWSQLGEVNKSIRVINRPQQSGTREIFQQLVLNGQNFGNMANFITMERDATTPILQALGKNGISYATFAQVANQLKVRTVAIDGLTPEAPNYPYQRNLYYVYQNQSSPQVEAFLGYATSPQAQQIIENAKFTD